MNTFFTRLVCMVLSTLGAAGLFAFADPANAVGGLSQRAPVTVAAVANATAMTRHG